LLSLIALHLYLPPTKQAISLWQVFKIINIQSLLNLYDLLYAWLHGCACQMWH